MPDQAIRIAPRLNASELADWADRQRAIFASDRLFNGYPDPYASHLNAALQCMTLCESLRRSCSERGIYRRWLAELDLWFPGKMYAGTWKWTASTRHSGGQRMTIDTPTIIFDHINKVVAVAGTSPEADRKAAEFAIASQQQQHPRPASPGARGILSAHDTTHLGSVGT